MNNKNCFSIKKFNLLKTYVNNNSNSKIKLHERLIADKETISKELLFEDKYIELVENQKLCNIIIIDKKNKIPPYHCIIVDNDLQIAAYEARFDTAKDIDIRRNDWCEIITKLFSKKL